MIWLSLSIEIIMTFFSNNKRKLCNFASNGILRFEMLGYEKNHCIIIHPYKLFK